MMTQSLSLYAICEQSSDGVITCRIINDAEADKHSQFMPSCSVNMTEYGVRFIVWFDGMSWDGLAFAVKHPDFQSRVVKALGIAVENLLEQQKGSDQ